MECDSCGQPLPEKSMSYRESPKPIILEWKKSSSKMVMKIWRKASRFFVGIGAILAFFCVVTVPFCLVGWVLHFFYHFDLTAGPSDSSLIVKYLGNYWIAGVSSVAVLIATYYVLNWVYGIGKSIIGDQDGNA